MSRAVAGRSVSAVHADPGYAALAREAVAAIQAGDDAVAERAAAALVGANPREHAAWHVLAVVALRAGRAASAIEFAERAWQLDRKNVGYLNTLGIAYGDLGRADDAIATFRRALKLRPAFADCHYNLAKVLDRHEQLDGAREAYRRVLAIESGHANAKHNLARVLRRLGRSEEALGLARESHALAPENVDRTLGLACALADARGEPAAREFVERCLVSRPGEPRLRYWLAEFFLKQGDWEAGWREYLWRANAMRRRGLPLAALPENLEGAVVLVSDQGLGDTLFFLRFASDLVDRANRVVLQTPPKLAGVLAGRKDLLRLEIAADPAPAEVRATVLLGDLPCLAGVRAVAPPLRLTPRADLIEYWREALAALGAPPYVGLTWRGGTDLRTVSQLGGPRDDALFKEVPLRAVAKAVNGLPATLVAIQRLPAPGEVSALAVLAGQPVHDLSAENDDLERMTGLLAVLDEYVGVSNTNTHLRTGIGLAGKVLVPYPPEFRWMAAGDGSPWFPGTGVYRQRADRSWDEALARLAADLRGRGSR
jgi:tetratricopeptide (TPR) repeat protein